MSHFDLSKWADYVRGLGGPDSSSMEKHLLEGCEECTESAAFLRKVAAAANGFDKTGVPSAVAERAKGIFVKPKPAFDFARLLPLAARLILDTSAILQPAGIRNSGTAYQVLYKAGEYTVDLRQENVRGSVQIALVGQISSGTSPHIPGTNFPVTLHSGDTVISSTVSNDFGEFNFTYSPRPNMLLAIAVTEAGYKIDIPVSKLSNRT